jgi:YesN/AraC family two-component response regulator
MRDGSQSPLVGAVLSYVEEHFTEQISLRDVARALGYAPAHLTNTFRRRVGTPVNAWIIRRRIKAAQELFARTNADVPTVCEAVGFNDLCYFTRQFNRHAGSTPGRYRTSVRGSSRAAGRLSVGT